MAVTVGLDIGSTGIRAVALDTGKSPPLLRRIGEVPLPSGAVTGGEIIDEAAATRAISSLWKEHKLPKKRVVVGVANQRVIVRQVDVPLMSESELAEALPFQVQEYIPMDVGETILDHVPIEEFTTPEGQPMLSILAVAAHKAMVTEVLDVVSGAGLSVEAIDLQPFALVRSVLGTDFDLAAAQGIVDIGAGLTQVVVVKAGIPRFVRLIPRGGEEFTAALVDELDIVPDEAENLKRAVGVFPDEEAAAAAEGDQAEAQRILTAKGESFIEEIRGSVNFFLSQAGEDTLSRVVVAGNGARLPHLANRLGQALGARIEPARVLDRLDLGKITQDEVAPMQPILPTPVGLALWGE